MDILEFAGEVIVLSMSGVLSPGPLFLANLIYGSKQGYYAGIKIANGHMAVELLLIILLSLSIFGLSRFTVGPATLSVVGMIGAVAIILFSVVQISNIVKGIRNIGDAINKNNKSGKQLGIGHGSNYLFFLDKIKWRIDRGPLIVGIIFTAMNPFFVTWWLTVGLKLISDSIYLFGIVRGALVLFLFHIWMDYAWLALSAYLSSKGRSLFKGRTYYFFITCINITLILYGFYLLGKIVT
jgi:threonine/homoserine/homoserine lactone efflux protein